jgi:putative ABC transport system permease protein
MTTLINDIKFAFRQMLKKPGLTCFIILTLAIGIGANSTLFSVIYTVLLKPLPYPEPDQLMWVGTHWTSSDHKFPSQASPPDFKDWQEQNSTFGSLAAWYTQRVTLTGYDDPVTLEGLQVTSNFLTTLKRPPCLGRDFTKADTQGKSRVIILGHALWQNRFAADPTIVGRSIILDGRDYTVIGVADSDMVFIEDQGCFLVPMQDALFANVGRDNHFIWVFGRLKSGVSAEQGRADMLTITERLAQQYKVNEHKRIYVAPLRSMVVRGSKPMFWSLYGAVALLLLLACVNIANLLLARANHRQQEMTVRLALGAGRWRVMRQMLCESLLLALMGGVFGLFLAKVGLVAIAGFSANFDKYSVLSALKRIEMNLLCLLVTLGMTCLCAVLFGLVPALHACRINLNNVLKCAGRSFATSKAQHRTAGLLVIGEVALATMLLIGSGLLINSFQRLCRVNPGFEAEDILTVNLELPRTERYNNASKRVTFFRELLEKLRALPGVASAATINNPPMAASTNSLNFKVEGRAPLPGNETSTAFYHQVSDAYFETMQIPIQQGRVFNEADLNGDHFVVVVDETLVRKHFPNENPLGQRLFHGGKSKEIIGVVGDIHNRSLAEDPTKPMLYEPMNQACWNAQTVVCRTTGDPLALAEAVRQAVWSLDPAQPILKIDTIKREVLKTVSMERFSSLIMGFMAGVALILAVTGIYAVVAHSVSERVNEIGIRLALGAQKQNILTMILKKGLVYIVVGLGIGVSGALMTAKFLSSQLYQISATDPVTFAAVPVILLLTAVLACYIPARRAAKVDPMEALRYE